MQRHDKFPKFGVITVCPPGNPTHARNVCPQMWAFLIKRNIKFVRTKLIQIWENKLSNPNTPIFPRKALMEAKWKTNLKNWLLSLNLQVLHYCKSTGTIRLSLERTEEMPTLQSLYLKWIVHFNSDFAPYVKFLSDFAAWFKKKDRNTIPPPTYIECTLFPKFSTFRHYFYTNLNIKWGLRVKSKCDDCTTLKSLITESKTNNTRSAIEKTKTLELQLKHHIDRKDYKNNINFTNKINALKCWKKPNFEKILEDYKKLCEESSESEDSDSDLLHALGI